MKDYIDLNVITDYNESIDMDTEEQRIQMLTNTVDRYCPGFSHGIQIAKQKRIPLVMDHNEFSKTYTKDEYTLLGICVKFAGLHGVVLMFVGENGQESPISNLFDHT